MGVGRPGACHQELRIQIFHRGPRALRVLSAAVHRSDAAVS